MNKNITLVIILVVVLVALSIGILLWQSKTTIAPTETPIPSVSETVMPSATPDALYQEIDTSASVDMEADFKSIDADLKTL